MVDVASVEVFLRLNLQNHREKQKLASNRRKGRRERERGRGLLLVSIGFRGRYIACLAAALGPLAVRREENRVSIICMITEREI